MQTFWGFWDRFTEGTMVSGPNMRVGDTEREAVAAQLREHYADGRLTLDELNDRLDQALAAKTRADLNTVLRDLPTTPTARPLVSPQPAYDRQGPRPGYTLLAPVMALFWMAATLLGGLFLFGHGDRPIAVVLFLAALAFLRRLVFGRRRARGGGRRCGRR
jgi:hypothetical protein